MLNSSILNSHPGLSAPSIRSTPQEAVEASLGLAHSYAAQGKTTAALQVMTAVIELLMQIGPSPERQPAACNVQVVFETLRTFYGDTAAQSAAAR